MAEKKELIWLMTGLIIGSILIVCIVVYISRTQEWCCGIHKLRKDMEHEDDDVLEEMRDPEKGGVKIPTKTFVDSQKQGRMKEDDIRNIMHLSEDNRRLQKHPSSNVTAASSVSGQDASFTSLDQRISSSSGGDSSSSDVQKEKQLAVMVTAPRCVLCSQNFTIGEDVTHSNNPNCGHEYHELCLRKHWNNKCSKKSGMVGKCPVCKEPYVVAKTAPSKQFSTRSDLGEEEMDTKTMEERRESNE